MSNELRDLAVAGAIANVEVDYRIAVAQNDAFAALEESLGRTDLTPEKITQQLTASEEIPRKEHEQLEELLLQFADLQRLKGQPIDDLISDYAKKGHISLSWSNLFSEKVMDSVQPGDAAVIGQLLSDPKCPSDSRFTSKLRNDEERRQAFSFCKQRVRAGCIVIKCVQDLGVAADLFTQVAGLADKKSHSDQDDLESTGKNLAGKMVKAGKVLDLVNLVEKGVFKLPYLKNILPVLASEQQVLVTVLTMGDTIGDIAEILKFISDPKFLEPLKKPGAFPKLNTGAEDAASLCRRTSEALSKESTIKIFSRFDTNKPDKYSQELEAQNKFVIGITSDSQYCIALSSMRTHNRHENIFDAVNNSGLGKLNLTGGGFLGFEEKDGNVVVTIERKSSDFGFYSREVLEHFRPALETALQEAFPGKKLDLIIKRSSGF